MASIAEAITEVFNKGKLHGVQYLEQSMVKSKDKKIPHEHTEVTFVTEMADTNELCKIGDKLAVIVWVDREEFRKAADK